jgi:photosystem I P700 chlorophyll a apoprotein A1
LLFRYVNAKLWSKGHFNKALSKGPKTTTWIWNLHASAHDFDIGQSSARQASAEIARKVFSSNLAHLSLVFFWIGGMHFHGAYFSNYSAWLKDPERCLPSSHLVWSLVGQDILNGYSGQYFSGVTITSGFFQLWRSEGIITQTHLKYACAASLIATIACVWGSYCHMQITSPYSSFYKKFKRANEMRTSLIIIPHHLMVIFGLGCISWCSHQIHVSLPTNSLLDSGICMAGNADLMQVIFPRFGVGPLVDFALYLPGISVFASSGKLLNPSTGSIFLGQIAAHHFALGVVFIMVGVIGYLSVNYSVLDLLQQPHAQWHSQLSVNLAISGSLSIAFAHHLSAMPVYAYTLYPTMLCLFCHHMWIGGFLIVGAGAHASIYVIGSKTTGLEAVILSSTNWHRDSIIGHLIWVSIALGLHSFGLYIHNDTLEALGRPEDMFGDSSIQLKPIFANQISRGYSTVEVLHGKLIRLTQELGTADFMVHHIHAFTIHVTLLVLLKGLLYARSSRLVSDKLELGFRYPCDGPGRGGTCQISPWDHLYLAVFWMYNCLSLFLFHYFWKMQSDVWGVYDEAQQQISHMSGGDFSVNATTINGWLRNFLWSQAAQVIQSYASPSISSYGFIFISAHFVWAFSLMFLYSGRAYWQELIESILWAHHKLKIVPHIQPRALSISQGRAVGLTHYMLGGIGCTWAFFISRVIVLTS